MTFAKGYFKFYNVIENKILSDEVVIHIYFVANIYSVRFDKLINL